MRRETRACRTWCESCFWECGLLSSVQGSDRHPCLNVRPSVWNYDQRAIRWSEVKGPGDSLSSTQKVWIDVLLSAGIDVEVCKVVEEGDPGPAKKKRSRSGSVASTRAKSASVSRPGSEDEHVADEDTGRRPPLKKRKSSGAGSVKGPANKRVDDSVFDGPDCIVLD